MVRLDATTRLLQETEIKLRRAGLAALTVFGGATYYLLRQCCLIWWG